jgi:hypothetical protein
MNIRRIPKNPAIYQFGLLRHWNKNILVVDKQWLGTHPYSRFTNATFAPPLLFSFHVFVACDRVRERCSEKGMMGEHLAIWHQSQTLILIMKYEKLHTYLKLRVWVEFFREIFYGHYYWYTSNESMAILK